MSRPEANSSLSMTARLLVYLGPPSVILGVSYISPKTGALSPLAFVPSVWAYRKWHQQNEIEPSRRAELEPLIWTYILSGTIGVAAVSALQAAAGYGLSTLLFGNGEMRDYFLKEAMRPSIAGLTPEDLRRRAELAHSWKNIAFNALGCFSAAGLGEELLKYLPVIYASRRGSPEEKKPRKWAYLEYALSSSLAFGVIEGIGFIYTYCVSGQETGGKLALSVAERLLLGSSGHVLMAVLSALRATRRDYCGDEHLKWWQIVGPSALVHGAFDFGALAFSASNGNVGWIHPTGVWQTTCMLALAVSFWAGTAWMVRRELRMISEYEQKAQ